VKTIVVTWMDCAQETYRVQRYRAEDSSLTLWSPNDVSQPDVHIPLANVRTWTVEG